MRTNRRGLLGLAATSAAAGAALSGSGCARGLDTAEVTRLVETWADAVRRRDRAGLEATMTGSAAPRLIRTLLTVPFAEDGFSVRWTEFVQGTALIGLAWRLSGGRGVSEDTVVAPARRGWGGEDRLVIEPIELRGGVDHPVLHPFAPVWWLDDLTAEAADGVTVLRSTTQPRPGSRWLDLAVAARRAAVAVTGRPGPLTVVVPSSPQILRQVVPIDDAPEDARAAFAWSLGDPDGPIHVFVDPVAAAAVGDTEVQWLLTHETVHVLTAAPRTTLPLWVEEGFADAIAFADDVAAGWRVNRVLADAVRAGERPTMLAPDEAFGGGAEQAMAYATAWSVSAWLTEVAGPTGLRRWYDLQTPPDGGAGIAEADAWRRVTATDPARREPAWRAWLERTAPR